MTSMQNTPSSAAPPQAQANFTMPKKKSGGCGCCLMGCFGFVVLLILGMVGGYFVLKNSPDLILSDTVVQWTYTNYARPKIAEFLPANMSPAEKQRAMAVADSALKDYMGLSEADKSVLRKEALIAAQYYSEGKIIPHDQIPHLLQFIQQQEKTYEQFNPTPRLSQ